ncbi:MAG: exodeoxyribonuclease VII small subunit [Bacteroidetes bacterium]|nr:MAG: exodeoxyribonuclease VII small subunit [Bacteroidota bacterium]
MSKNQTYRQAIDELEAIVNEIENEEISVDELSEKVKRASQLIVLCKTKLTKTEEEVSKVLEEMKKVENEKE